MAKRVQRRRGTTAEHGSFTGAVGEISVDTTKDTVAVHDGSQAGGFPLAREDMNNVTNRVGITQLNCADGSANQFLKTNGSGTLSFATVDATSAAVGGDLSGTVGNAQIVANAVTATELATNAVTTVNITDANVTTAKIADGAVNAAKIAALTIATDKIADSQITSAKILNGTIVAADLADDAVTSAKILDGNVATINLADAAVTTVKIADGNVTTNKIADSNVTTIKIADNTIDHTKMKDAFIPDYTETDPQLQDRIIFSDGTDSGNTKQDTLGGVADLIYNLPFTPDTTPADHAASGPHINTIVSGYTSTIMDLVYLDNQNPPAWESVDNAGGSNFMGIALEAKTNGQAMNVALPGSIVRDDSWSWTAGETLYASMSNGLMTTTRPSSSGDVVRVVGWTLTADEIYFNPSADYITIV